MSFQILQRAYAPYGTAAQFPASGDSRLIYRATDTGYLYTWDASESAYKLAGIDPATAPYLGLHAQADDAARLGGQLPSYYAANGHTHAQSAIDSSSGWITTALAGKQAAGSYLTTTGTAADSAKLGGQLPSYYAQASHVHNYAGSASPGGSASDAEKLGGYSPEHFSFDGHGHSQGSIDSGYGWISTALALRVSTASTALGSYGDTASGGVLSSAASWANLPVGYSRIHNADGSVGFPTATQYYYITKIANLDVWGGYCVRAVQYTTAEVWYGVSTSSAALPTWRKCA